MVKRIKDKKIEGLEKIFYIITVNRGKQNEMWQLRLRSNHFVMSAVTTKEDVVRCLRLICMRYKTLHTLERHLRKCEDHRSKEQMQRSVEEYQKHGVLMNDEVDDIVDACMAEIEQTRQSKKKVSRVINKVDDTPIKQKEVLSHETPTVVKVMPKKRSRIGKVTL